MDDLISRQAAIDAMKNMYQAAEKWGREASDDVIKARAESCMATLVETKLRIEELPAAQPERKKGRWVEVTDGTCIWKVCDQCGEKPLWNEWRTDRCESDFCPNCGARMDGGEQDG